MTDTPAPSSGAWVLYDFDRDGLDIFDSDRFDYYFLVFKSGSLDDGTVMRALYAGPRGLASGEQDPHDASYYLDPRSVAAYVATPRPEVTDELVAAIATAPRKISLWHGGAVVGTITGRRLRDSLAGLYGRGLRFVDGQITTVDLDLEDTADDVYWLGDTVLVTPVRMDVLLSTTAELMKERSESRSEERAASEARRKKGGPACAAREGGPPRCFGYRIRRYGRAGRVGTASGGFCAVRPAGRVHGVCRQDQTGALLGFCDNDKPAHR